MATQKDMDIRDFKTTSTNRNPPGYARLERAGQVAKLGAS
jgi:hypothetical protein